jgi:hypothetical protein
MPGAAVQGLALWPKKKNPKYVQIAECTNRAFKDFQDTGFLSLSVQGTYHYPARKYIHNTNNPTTHMSAWYGFGT